MEVSCEGGGDGIVVWSCVAWCVVDEVFVYHSAAASLPFSGNF